MDQIRVDLNQRGTPTNTFSHFENKTFVFLIDPRFFNPRLKYRLITFIRDLISADPPVSIYLAVPFYLNPSSRNFYTGNMRSPFVEVQKWEGILSAFELSSKISVTHLDKLKSSEQTSKISLELIALAHYLQADGIVTNDGVLTKGKHALYQHHLLRIFSDDEFENAVEKIAHGNSIFWSVIDAQRRWTFDTFYPLLNPENKKLTEWFDLAHTGGNHKQEVLRSLNSIIRNRYPFLLYARDMVCYYQFQRDYFTRRGLMQRFGMAIGYHMATFYFLLWGMLDHLANLTNIVCDLKINERRCGIRSKLFLKSIEKEKIELRNFLDSDTIKSWIDQMADVRHKASHDEIPIPTKFLIKTPESTKSDDEIITELRKEYSLLIEIMPPDFLNVWLKNAIPVWRVRKMESLADDAIFIKRKDGSMYMRGAVISIDHDLDQLTEIIWKFFSLLFSQASEVKNPTISSSLS